MTRRRALELVLVVVSTITTGTRWFAGGLWAGSPATGTAPTATSGGPPISGAELGALVAFAEVLVDARLLSNDTRRELTDHLIDSARGDAEQRALYVATARLLDRLAGRSFAALTVAERVALVDRQRLNVPPLTAYESAGAIPDETRDVRTRVVPDLISACWRSPGGWDAVGYAAFPGRCGDLARYTRPEPDGR
jgi:hypothetical protein